MTRNIVFDLGGVLIYWYPEEALAALDPADREAVEDAVYRSPDWPRYDHGDFTEAELIARCEARVPERLRPEIRRFVRWYELTGAVDGMEDLTRELADAGYDLYLLSNTSVTFHEYRTRIPALGRFKGEFISADWHLMKPSPAIFEAFCGHFGLEPSACLFIDDSEKNVEGARQTGMDGIVFGGRAADLREELRERGIRV